MFNGLVVEMPCEAGTEDIPVGGVVRHGQVIGVGFHHEMIKMLILRKEAQVDGAYEETGVHAHPGIVTDFGCLLGSEHPCCGTEDGCLIAREIAQVHTDLCVHRTFEP